MARMFCGWSCLLVGATALNPSVMMPPSPGRFAKLPASAAVAQMPRTVVGEIVGTTGKNAMPSVRTQHGWKQTGGALIESVSMSPTDSMHQAHFLRQHVPPRSNTPTVSAIGLVMSLGTLVLAGTAAKGLWRRRPQAAITKHSKFEMAASNSLSLTRGRSVSDMGRALPCGRGFRTIARAEAVPAESGALDGQPALRFSVGDRVECNFDGWMPGVVIKQWYREPGSDESVPYQVKLDTGMTIFAPADEEPCIRRATGILKHGKIPVTILTGFLGAGKTTLLNYILNTQHGMKYAVIENEFGDAAIDEMLVDESVGKKSTMESITVLDNGCLCCTLRDDLVEAIRGIVSTVQQRLDQGVPGAMLDGILIETTGMADPGPICKTFDLDPVVSRYCKIDGILTVVDSVHFLDQLGRERTEGAVNESAQQVAFADKVLLNKVDAVCAGRLRKTKLSIQAINTIAPVVECSLATKPDKVPINELLALEAFDTTTLLTEDGERGGFDLGRKSSSGSGETNNFGSASSCSAPSCDEPTCTDESHGRTHSHASSFRHDTEIGTMLLELSGSPLDFHRFQHFLGQILEERSADLYRYKGVLAVLQKDIVVRYVLQGVHDMMECSFSGEWPADVPVKTQIVLIGRKLEKELWSDGFAACASERMAKQLVQ